MGFVADACVELLHAEWTNCAQISRILWYPQFLSNETI
jgi:hypothetical protein